jgi:hypothetical protein
MGPGAAAFVRLGAIGWAVANNECWAGPWWKVDMGWALAQMGVELGQRLAQAWKRAGAIEGGGKETEAEEGQDSP